MQAGLPRRHHDARRRLPRGRWNPALARRGRARRLARRDLPGRNRARAHLRSRQGRRPRVSPVERRVYDFVASSIGQVLRQDAVGWMRPLPDRPRIASGAVKINLGRRLTDTEVTALDRALNGDAENPRFIIRHQGARGVVVTQNDYLPDQLPNYARGKAAYERSFQGRVHTAGRRHLRRRRPCRLPCIRWRTRRSGDVYPTPRRCGPRRGPNWRSGTARGCSRFTR